MKSYGSAAFAVAAPDLRNSLPYNIRSCDNLSNFKTLLKTHLKSLLLLVWPFFFITILFRQLFAYLFVWNVNIYLLIYSFAHAYVKRLEQD